MDANYKRVIQDLISNMCPDGAVGAEIGTRKGYSASAILQCENVSKIYLVDPYKRFLKDIKQKAVNRYLQRALKRLSTFGDRATFIRYTSMEAISIINDPLDFVYIDGNHEYSFVKDDVSCWFNKIKSGALCFGHDWVDESHMDFNSLGGVRKAILEFVDNHKEQICREYISSCKFDYIHINNGLYVSVPIDDDIRIWWFVKK